LSKAVAAPAERFTIDHDNTSVKSTTRNLQNRTDKLGIRNLIRKKVAGGCNTQLEVAVAAPTIQLAGGRYCARVKSAGTD
jgi:hypothetical protein